jgi:hypothetical protein
MSLRKCRWAWALVLVIGCGDDESATPATIDRSLLDASASSAASASRTEADTVDAGSYVVASSVDAAALTPPCPAFDVCTENKPGLLYNVCLSGVPSGAVSEPACLVDPNGTLYLAPLTTGQLVLSKGWTQSTNASLSAADQERCETARAALLADAATPPKCAGGV